MRRSKISASLQIELTEATGKTVKRTYSHETNDENLRQDISRHSMIASMRQPVN